MLNRKRRKPVDPTAFMHEDDRKEYLRQQVLETPIAEMGLSVRIVNALEEENMLMASQLLSKTKDELMKIRNFGDTTMREIIIAVKRMNIPVPPTWEPKRRRTRKDSK